MKGDKSQRNDKVKADSKEEKKEQVKAKESKRGKKSKTSISISENQYLLADAKKLVKPRKFAFKPLKDFPDMFSDLPILPDLFDFYEQYQLGGENSVNKEQATRLTLSNIRKTEPFPKEAQNFLNGNPLPFDLPVYMRKAIQIILQTFKNPDLRNEFPSLKVLHETLVGDDIDDGTDNMYSLGISSIIITITEGLFKPDKKLKKYILEELGKESPAMKALLETKTLTPETAREVSQTSLIYPANYAGLMNIGVGNLVQEYFQGMDMAETAKNVYQQNPRNWGDGEIIGTLKYITAPARLIRIKVHYAIFG